MNAIQQSSNAPRLKVHEWISCVSCFFMITGMVCSRSLLSLGMVLLLLNALYPGKVAVYWRQFRSSAFAVLSLLFFCAYLVSGFWSEDKANWLEMVQIKLPFLFFPFALMSLPVHNRRWLTYMVAGMLLALAGGMAYSVFFLAANPDLFATGTHLVSPMEGDYIRFTIVLVLAMIFVVYLIDNKSSFGLRKAAVVALIVWVVIAVLYIHLQAAKSGLVSFYILYAGLVFCYARRKKSILYAVLLFAAGGLGLWMSTHLPAMSYQVKQVSREGASLANEQENSLVDKRVNTGSVVARLKSYKVALGAMSGHWLMGVGAGDMEKAMGQEYDRTDPGLPAPYKILPHNQVLCSLLSIGTPLTLLLLVPLMFAALFKRKNRSDPYVLLSWAIIFFGLMIEPMLEVQYGVFVFLYFSYLWPALKNAGNNIPVGASV